MVTPADAVALLGSLDRDSVVTVHPCMGGMPTEVGWTSLELLVDKVLPEIELSPSPYVTQVWAPEGIDSSDGDLSFVMCDAAAPAEASKAQRF